MTNVILKSFREETGLNVREGQEDGLIFSAREIYGKLYQILNNSFGTNLTETQKDIEGVTDFRHWIQRNMLEVVDENGNPLFTNYKQSKIKASAGRPMIDYLVDEETAKILILRSNTLAGFGLLKRLIRLEKEYSKYIKQRLDGKAAFIAMTDSIVHDHDPLKPYHFSNEVNMIYRIVFAKTAKELSDERGVKENEDLRNFLTDEERKVLIKMEMKNAVYIDDGIDYQTRKQKLIDWFSGQHDLLAS